MDMNNRRWKQLEADLGHSFKNHGLLLEALTHSTYAYEHRQNKMRNNERLEFLGDAVLDLAVSDILYKAKNAYDEGFMTKARSLIVCEGSLADLAKSLHIGEMLLLGKGEDATGGRMKPSNLSNAMEAILGALYLDAGFDQVKAAIARLFEKSLKLAVNGQIVHDYKSRLLEMVQATRGGSSIKFVILKEEGPVHAREFTAGIQLDDELIAEGKGSSKKEAEQQAAGQAIDRLDCDRTSCKVIHEDAE